MEDTGGFNALDRIFGLFEKKLDADAQAKSAQGWLQGNQFYGVDELGRVYVRGQPGVSTAPGSITPLITIGAGILAVTLIIWALKS